MYKAPDFVKVDFKIDEAFATYNCEYMSDGSSYWMFTGDNCQEEMYTGGTDISGSAPSQATYECWLSPSA